MQGVSNSEIGPDIQLTSYKYSDWQEARFEPARFDDGLFVNHDIGEGSNNDGANFFAINTGGMGWSPDHGAIEFWFKFRYDAGTRNHAYFFDMRNAFMDHYPDQNWTTGLDFAAGWNGWDYGSYGKRFFFGVGNVHTERRRAHPQLFSLPRRLVGLRRRHSDALRLRVG